MRGRGIPAGRLTLLAAVDELHAVPEEFPGDIEELLHLVGHCKDRDVGGIGDGRKRKTRNVWKGWRDGMRFN